MVSSGGATGSGAGAGAGTGATATGSGAGAGFTLDISVDGLADTETFALGANSDDFLTDLGRVQMAKL